MINLPNALLIGATSKNCGKTTFVCQLLELHKAHHPIAVKIKTLYPGDGKWHGKGSDLEGKFTLREEFQDSGLEDSGRMLLSGANRVFYIKSASDNLEEAVAKFLENVPSHSPILFESNSVRDIIQPAAFIMIKGADPKDYKPSSLRLMEFADIHIKTDGERHDPSPSEIRLTWSGHRFNLG